MAMELTMVTMGLVGATKLLQAAYGFDDEHGKLVISLIYILLEIRGLKQTPYFMC